MVGELQVIFQIDPVTLHLRVACKVFVFLEQLSGIAARAIINAIARFRTATRASTLLTLLPTTTAATAAGLTIVDQTAVLVAVKVTPVPSLAAHRTGCALPVTIAEPFADHMTWNRAISQFSTGYVEKSLPLPH